jgi:hypothetical protein
MEPQSDYSSNEYPREETAGDIVIKALTFGYRPMGQVFTIWRLIIGALLLVIGIPSDNIGLIILGFVLIGGVPFIRACWNSLIH